MIPRMSDSMRGGTLRKVDSVGSHTQCRNIWWKDDLETRPSSLSQRPVSSARRSSAKRWNSSKRFVIFGAGSGVSCGESKVLTESLHAAASRTIPQVWTMILCSARSMAVRRR